MLSYHAAISSRRSKIGLRGYCRGLLKPYIRRIKASLVDASLQPNPAREKKRRRAREREKEQKTDGMTRNKRG